MDDVIAEHELLSAVGDAFTLTGRGFMPWPDPHPDREPLPEEYERLTDRTKWQIIGARAEAWLVAIVEAGLAVVERDVALDWQGEPPPWIVRTDRVVPFAVRRAPAGRRPHQD